MQVLNKPKKKKQVPMAIMVLGFKIKTSRCKTKSSRSKQITHRWPLNWVYLFILWKRQHVKNELLKVKLFVAVKVNVANSKKRKFVFDIRTLKTVVWTKAIYWTIWLCFATFAHSLLSPDSSSRFPMLIYRSLV